MATSSGEEMSDGQPRGEPLASPAAFGEDLSVTDLAATYVAVGLTIAFALGVLCTKFMGALRAMYGAQLAVKLATAAMRASRLRLALLLVVIFAVAWPWIHGFG